MSAPAGWYDDGSGRQRWWDGAAWGVYAQDVSPAPYGGPSAGHGQVAVSTGRAMKSSGLFNALGQAVKNAAAEQKDAAIGRLTAGARARREREERKRQERLRQAEHARMAGRQVTSGEFGTSMIEIYENGYVRVAGPGDEGYSCQITDSTPYENLISISFERPDNGGADSRRVDGVFDSAGSVRMPSVATAGTAVKMVSMIAKRNPTVMAISGVVGVAAAGAGVAAAGASAVAKMMAAKSVLTITTGQRIHVLTNQAKHPTTGILMPRKDHERTGEVLERTGNSILTALGRGPVAEGAPALPSGRVDAPEEVSSSSISSADVAASLRELAKLHDDGILDDADFLIAKRQLLGKL